MTDYCYDLHIHSCLSPCADDDMTPASIAGMAVLNGLQLVALTDHNACGNCEAFMQACKAYGIVGVPGMELTTAEEIHMVCLFPELENALAFEQEVRKHFLGVKNRPAIFGNQLLTDAEDNVLGEEEALLIAATSLTLSDGYALTRAHGGAAYPAHIDREANGIVAILGTVPQDPAFPTVELRDRENAAAYTEQHGLAGKRLVFSSDAHHLWDIQEAGPRLALDDEPYCSRKVRHALIALLRGDA